MKLNDDKCHLMIFGNKAEYTTVKVGNSKVKEVPVKNYLAALLMEDKVLKIMLKIYVKKLIKSFLLI